MYTCSKICMKRNVLILSSYYQIWRSSVYVSDRRPFVPVAHEVRYYGSYGAKRNSSFSSVLSKFRSLKSKEMRNVNDLGRGVVVDVKIRPNLAFSMFQLHSSCFSQSARSCINTERLLKERPFSILLESKHKEQVNSYQKILETLTSTSTI